MAPELLGVEHHQLAAGQQDPRHVDHGQPGETEQSGHHSQINVDSSTRDEGFKTCHNDTDQGHQGQEFWGFKLALQATLCYENTVIDISWRFGA